MRAITGILKVLIGILLFIAVKKWAGKHQIQHRVGWGIGICLILLMLNTVLTVIGTKNQVFRSPEEAYRCNNKGQIALVINGEETDMAVGRELGTDNTQIIAILPKSEKGWGVSSGLDIKDIYSGIVDGIYISVMQYKDTDDYYIEVTDLFGNDLTVRDNMDSVFSRYVTEEKYYYYAYIKNFSIEEYKVEINGRIFRITSGNPRLFNCRDESVRQEKTNTSSLFLAFSILFCYTICMKENLIHSRTCVYNINYHVVWSVKYRRKILSPEIEDYLKELVQRIAEDKGFTVHLFETGEGDHLHCFVSAPPKLSVTDIVKYLKGITGRKLFEQFPEIRQKLWKGQLWNHSYYVETIGSVSEENIRRYIEHQSKSY